MNVNRRVIGCLATWFVVGMALGLTPPGAQASDRKPSLKTVTDALDQMSDDFCQTFKLKCPARSKPAPRRVETPKASKTPAGPSLASIDTTSTAAKVPIPKQKPNRPKPEQAVTLESPGGTPPPAPKRSTVLENAQEMTSVHVVLPTPKPTKRAKPESQTVPAPQSEPVAMEQASAPSAATGVDESCMSQLKGAGVRFEVAVAPADGPSCQIETPVRMFAVETATGIITLPENPLLNCKFALQFSLWLSDAAAPGVATRKNSRLARVATGPGYECRGRNGDSTSKFSEHATGNAVDITTFTLEDGRIIQVAEAGDLSAASYQLLRGLRTTACGYFSTVLGPGSNAAHASHFHFDMGRHGKSASYKICE